MPRIIIPASVIAAPFGVRAAHGMSRRTLELAFAALPRARWLCASRLRCCYPRRELDWGRSQALRAASISVPKARRGCRIMQKMATGKSGAGRPRVGGSGRPAGRPASVGSCAGR